MRSNRAGPRDSQLDVVFGAGDDRHRLRRPLPAARHHRSRHAVPARCAASSTAKRNACGVWARNRPSRGTVAGCAPLRRASAYRRPGRPELRRASSSAASRAGIVPTGIMRAGRVVHQNDVGRGPPAPPARHARCPAASRRREPSGGGRRPVSAAQSPRHRQPAAAGPPVRPALRRHGGSPACRPAARTALASRAEPAAGTSGHRMAAIAWPQASPTHARSRQSGTAKNIVKRCRFRIAHNKAWQFSLPK